MKAGVYMHGERQRGRRKGSVLSYIRHVCMEEYVGMARVKKRSGEVGRDEALCGCILR